MTIQESPPVAAPLYTNELAEKFGVTPRTVRYYRDQKMLRVTRHNKRDVYDHPAQVTMALILVARSLDMSTEEIREALTGDGQSLRLSRELVDAKLTAARSALTEAGAACAILEPIAGEMDDDDSTTTVLILSDVAEALKGAHHV